MRAKLVMSQRIEDNKPDISGMLDKLMRSIESKLANHHMSILSTDWRSLPELTNSNAQVYITTSYTCIYYCCISYYCGQHDGNSFSIFS